LDIAVPMFPFSGFSLWSYAKEVQCTTLTTDLQDVRNKGENTVLTTTTDVFQYM